MSLALAIGAGVAMTAAAAPSVLAARQTAKLKAAYAPDGTWLSLSDRRRLHVREAGAQAAAPVLLIHGAAAHGLAMLVALEDALGHHARLIAPDRPGLGWSDPLAPGGDRLAGHAGAMAQVIRAQNVGPMLVVGHSYGATAALRLAIDHPEAVKALVLLAPASTAYVGPASWYNYVATWPILGPLLTRVAVPLLGPRQMTPGIDGVFAPQSAPADYAAAARQKRLFVPAVFAENAKDLAVVNRELADQMANYASITVPVAIIAGDADQTVYTHRHAEELAAALPDARLAILPGVGHMPHHADPALVAEHVRALS